MPPKKDITKYFAKSTFNSISPATYVVRCSDGQVQYKQSRKTTSKGTMNITDPIKNITLTAKIFESNMLPGDHMIAGDCGSPLCVKTEIGYAILGYHISYDNGKALTIATPFELIEQIKLRADSFFTTPGSLEFVSAQGYERKLGDLHHKSVFRYIESGRLNILGSFTDFRGAHKSSVTHTPMSYKLPEYQIKFTKPVMSGWVPWRIAALDMTTPCHKLSSSVLNECKNGFIRDVMSSMKRTENIKEMVIILDDFTAINGAEVAYIDKINRNTSAGNPYKKCKKFFLKSIPPAHGMQDPVEVDPLIMDRVSTMIEVYESGARVNPVFCAHLKDEPVSFKKAKTGKTRVFAGAPFDWCIVVRKYFAGIVRLIQNERLAFESGPGTIVQSLEWEELYNYITLHGENRIIAGDYKAFDKSMSPIEVLYAFDVLIAFADASGNYTPLDIKVMRGIANDTAFAIIDFNGDLIQMFGSNPSGNPLTVILNGIVNCMRMRYVYWGLNPQHEIMSFKRNVSLMTYGDDNIMSVSKNTDWFNHTDIAQLFAHFDIGYTMAEKEAESVPFIHIKDASFLKRTWRFDDELQCHVAPLEHDSIEKMCMVWNKSKSITEEAQGIAIISTALQEYWFYGEAKYNERLLRFQKLIKDMSWEFWVEENTFMSYDDIKAKFFDSSKKHPLYREIQDARIDRDI